MVEAKAKTGKVEKKMQAFGGAAIISGVIVWALTSFVPNWDANTGGLPEPILALINWLVPIAIGAIAGWKAKHTERPGLDAKHKVVRPEPEKFGQTRGPATPGGPIGGPPSGQGAGDDDPHRPL